MDPKHDKHNLLSPHISAFMLGKTVIRKKRQDIFDMAGSGFESTVRLAKFTSDVDAHFKQNKVQVMRP
jgi:prephenate dehydrogenase